MKKRFAYLLATLGLLVMNCGAGCANILHDTPAKTELEVAQCYAAAERDYMTAHDSYCGAEVTPAECVYTETLRAARSETQDGCEQ